MANSFDKMAILDSFLDEVRSYVPEIAENLQQLEQNPVDAELIEETYRRAHTICGSALMMDFPGLASVARGMEETLDGALEGTVVLDMARINLLRRSLGRVQRLLEIAHENGDESPLVCEDEADRKAFSQASAAAEAPGQTVPLAALQLPEQEAITRELPAVDREPAVPADTPEWLAMLQEPPDAAASSPAAPTAATVEPTVVELEAAWDTTPMLAQRSEGTRIEGIPDKVHGEAPEDREEHTGGAERGEETRAEALPPAEDLLDEEFPSVASLEEMLPPGALLSLDEPPVEEARAEEASMPAGLLEDAAPMPGIPSASVEPQVVPETMRLAALPPEWEAVAQSSLTLYNSTGSLGELVAAVRATVDQLEGQRAELRGFLDGSGDALTRLETWASQAVGYDLRRGPDHVRRYLPVSLVWVITSRLKNLLALLSNATTDLDVTRETLEQAARDLMRAVNAWGAMLQQRSTAGALSATIAQIPWRPGEGSMPPEISAAIETLKQLGLPVPADIVPAQDDRDEGAAEAAAPAHDPALVAAISEQVRQELRAELAGQVRAELEQKLREELEIEVRQDFLNRLPPMPSGRFNPLPHAGAMPPAVVTSVPIDTRARPLALPVSVPARPASTVDLSEETLEVFRLEAEEHLQTIGMGVASLEKTPDDRAIIQSIRRATHTLKGAAAMMGFSAVAQLAHVSEDLLDRIMEGVIDITPMVLSLILDTSEALETLVMGNAGQHGGETALVAPLRRRYARLLDGDTGEATEGDAAAVDPALELEAEAEAELLTASTTAVGASVEARPAARDLSVRVRLQRLDELVNLFGELLVNRTVLEERLTRLNRLIADASLTSTRLRDVGQKLESRFEAATLPSGRQVQVMPGQGKASTPFVSLTAERSNGQEPAYRADFDELELDRYTEFHQLARGLSESISDVTTLSTEMEALIRECETILSRETRLNSAFQDRLLKTRLVPLSTMAPRLYRAARAVAFKQGKDIEFLLEGEETEVDRTVYEEIAGPLIHLVRNAVIHGIESPDARIRLGKPRTGVIRLQAYYEGNQVVISVREDGAGVNIEKVRAQALAHGLVDPQTPLSEVEALRLIFQPGFSTAESISEESGRGVGLDVVRDAVARLRGTLEVESAPGYGTAFTMKFPISLAIQRAVLVRVETHTYAIPMTVISQIGRLDYYERRPGPEPLLDVRGELYPIVSLGELLQQPVSGEDPQSPVLMIDAGRQRLALRIDAIVGRQEIVAKSLGPHLRKVPGVAGATVLGSGEVVLILELLELLAQREAAMRPKPLLVPAPFTLPVLEQPPQPATAPNAPSQGYVLIVDDSPSVRRVVGNMLKQAGWEVQVARDGVEALEVIARKTPAAVLLDIEMPRMDGYELMATLRSQEQHQNLPLIVLTSRAASKHQQRAMQIGANAYLIKPYRDEELLSLLRELTAGAPV
jgi:chemotaxis protein histidine kinase CheA/CheY-like chemotaxis protein